MQQYEVIKGITLALGRMLSTSVGECSGRKVRVLFEYAEDARKGDGALTVLQYAMERRPGTAEREYEASGGAGERFRNPPLLLRAKYIVSAWARPPEDQALLGAVMRTFLDDPVLEVAAEEEAAVAYDGPPGIDFEPLSFELHKYLAESFGMPLAPSASYTVSFNIQSAKTTPIKRVKERVIDFRHIES